MGIYAGASAEGFFSEEGYHFPKRLLDKAFNPDGSINGNAPTFRECVKSYWKIYHQYKTYRDYIKANPSKKYAPAKYKIPIISNVLPDWFHTILDHTISKAEGAKKALYMKSELYRLKLNALVAFEKVDNMELQAHFAPVGLMFNKGTLSDWDQYQDQTIWDRVKDTGKDLFYRLDYSSGATLEQKRKEEKAFVEGEGKTRMVKTNIANTAGIKKWVDQAKEELKITKHWYSDIVDWARGDKEYDGLGWAHGARQNNTRRNKKLLSLKVLVFLVTFFLISCESRAQITPPIPQKTTVKVPNHDSKYDSTLYWCSNNYYTKIQDSSFKNNIENISMILKNYSLKKGKLFF